MAKIPVVNIKHYNKKGRQYTNLFAPRAGLKTNRCNSFYVVIYHYFISFRDKRQVMIFRQKPPDLTPGKKPSRRDLRLYNIRKSKPLIQDLAVKYKLMIESGEVKNQADLARNVGLSRARITQVMNVLQ